MSVFGLRPEEPAVVRLREAAARGTLSHALLFTGSGDREGAARAGQGEARKAGANEIYFFAALLYNPPCRP